MKLKKLYNKNVYLVELQEHDLVKEPKGSEMVVALCARKKGLNLK
jgi:hypothetical protein